MPAKKNLGISISATLIMAAVSPLFAGFMKNRVVMKSNPNATEKNELWSMAEYLDFNSTETKLGRQWAMESTGEKFTYFQIPGQAGSGAHCYEILTAKNASATDFAEYNNADTKFFIQNPAGTNPWIFVSDDFGGTRYSRTRIWTSGAHTMNFKVAAYSLAYNDIDFYLITRSLKYTTWEGCKGEGISAVNAFDYQNYKFFIL